MNLTQIYLDTFIPEYPKIINSNFASVSRYVDIFYDGSLGILTKPLVTTGRVKGARGEFVTAVVDNLIVKNQFTNLFDNNTTADYNFYKLYIDPAVQPRDPCTAVDYWPQELSGYKYIDVNKPYYKIQNITEPYVFVNDNLSQVVGIFLDPSLVDPAESFKVILDPHYPYQYFTADPSAAGDPSAGTGFYVEFIAVSYDPSYGTTWAQYKQGIPVVGSGSGGGGSVGPGTPNYIPMFGLPTTITDSPLSISGTTLYTQNINVGGLSYITAPRVSILNSPTFYDDAVRKDYVDNNFSTNASVNTALAQFIRSASTGPTLVWNSGVLDVCVNVSGISFIDMKNYVDPSLLARDASIANLYLIKANNASLGLYATNASINAAGFAKNASFGLYSTTAQMNAALALRDVSIAWLDANKANNASLGLYATNASINTALANYTTKIYVDGSLAARDASITWLFNNTLTVTALNPYATNASIGLAGFLKATDISSFATNASVGLALQSYITNASVNTALAQFIRSTSTGYGLYWNGTVLDVSLAGISGAITFADMVAYVDPSLSERDASISFLFNNFVSQNYLNFELTNYVKLVDCPSIIGFYTDILNASVNLAFQNYYDISTIDSLFVSKAYVDGSLYDMQLQIFSLDNRVTILENSTGNATFAYVDGSLATRDSSIILLFSRLASTDSSLDILTTRHNITEASLGALTLASLNFATNASIAAADFAKNSSMNFVYKWQVSQDVSIVDLRGTNNTQTAQINSLNTRMTGAETSIAWINARAVKDASLSNDFVWNGPLLEVSIAAVNDAATNASLYYEVNNLQNQIDLKVDQLYVDSTLAGFISSASTGVGLYWNGPFLDVSVSSVDYTYIDGSLATRDSSIDYLFSWDYSKDASIVELRTADLAFATNASVNLALGAYATNASIGTFKTNYIDPSINAKFNISGGLITGGVQIGTMGNPVDVCIYNSLYVASHTHIGGNLTVDGSLLYTNVASLDVSTTYIKLNTGLVGAPPPGLQSGIVVERGSANPYIFVYDEDQQTFRIGISYQETSTHYNDASTQAVATRQDFPLSQGIAYWNASLNRFDTSTGITLDYLNGFATNSSVNLALGDYATNASVNLALGAYATNASIATAGFAKNASLGPLYSGLADVSNGIIISNSFNRTTQVLTLTRRDGGTLTAQFDATYVKETSLGSKFIWTGNLLDISVGAGVTSLSALSDVSIVSIIDKNLLQYDSVSGKWKNVSMADASNYFWSTSVALLREASLNMAKFNWVGGLLEPSTAGGGGVSQAYVDGSLATRDSSIIALFAKNAAQDASIIRIDASLNDTIDISTILGSYATNASVNTSFAQFVRSSSTRTGLTWSGGYLDVSTSLSLLTDVSISSISDGNFLKYDLASGKWKNVAALDASSYFQLKIAKNTIPGTGSTGNPGDWSYDASYLYLCTSTNKWGRVLLDYAF